MMKLVVDRKWKKDTYVIGRLYVDGVFECNTLEDRDRGLKQTDSLSFIRARKVYAETAIPSGTYVITMDIVSGKYSAVQYYWNLCKGKMPRLLDVPGFDGILIHPGNTALDSSGCLLVGKNTVKGRLTSSRECFERLYKKMRKAADKGEKITIEIK